MVDPLVSSTIKTLVNLLRKEAVFLWGVRDKIQQLKAEFMRIQCFLKDANAKKHESNSIRHWISEIRDIAYDAEDILERYVLQQASKRGGGGFTGFLTGLVDIFYDLVTLHQVGSKIDKFNARLSEINKSFTAYCIKETFLAASSSSQDNQPNPYETFPHVVDTDLVGLEHNVEELVSNLVDTKYGSVSIWGMGGVGKTTLAKQIYNHNKVRNHFTHFAWACISQQCQTKSQLEEILIKFSSPTPSPSDRQRIKDLPLQQVAQELSTFMKNNKCLVVVDDIWKVEDWDSLKVAFPHESGSKILLTSRVQGLASRMNVDLRGRSITHELHPLREEQSWDLFKKIVFWGENNAELEELGKKMVRHCKGLPLTIRVLGGLLTEKMDIRKWEILYNDIKSWPEGDATILVDNVLSLSYDHLSIELKPCFLYMSIFPEDYEIPVQKLFHYWVAEGFVSSSIGNTAEDHCKIYMCKLIERSMVLKGTTDEERGLEMESCQMHDRMREFCLSKAKKENFLQVNDLSLQRENNDNLSRRLVVHLLEDKDLIEENHNRNPGLRSLIYLIPYYNHYGMLMESFIGLLFLRVLDLDNIQFKGKLHNDIGKLVHLRYLSLRNSDFTTLPASLGNLTLLLILDLRNNEITTRSIVIPNLIWKIENLMHLYLPESGIDSSSKIDLGKLRKLETLENFEIGVMNMRDLCDMVNLRKLRLIFSRDYRIKKEYIIFNDTLKIALTNLRYLEIRFYGEPALVDGFVTQMVSACTNLYSLKVHGHTLIQKEVTFPAKITSMEFIKCIFEEEDPMSIFEKLPNLRYLKMWKVNFEGRHMVCSTGGFPQLRSLFLIVLDDLEEWRVEEGSMLHLRHLELSYCQHLKILPDGLRSISTLKELTIVEMPKELCDRLKEGGEDFHKFHHIPSLQIFENE